MTTNLALHDDLIREAQKLSGHRTKKAVITEALQEYVQRRKQMEIIHIEVAPIVRTDFYLFKVKTLPVVRLPVQPLVAS